MRTDLVSVTMQYLAMEFSSISGIYFRNASQTSGNSKKCKFSFHLKELPFNIFGINH
jgi:hypothetical protein